VKTENPEMTDAQLLVNVLDDMEFLGLIKWKPDADKLPTIDETPQAPGQQQASSDLALAVRNSRTSSAARRSLADQVRQLLEEAAPKAV
jgi:hypothetical protein